MARLTEENLKELVVNTHVSSLSQKGVKVGTESVDSVEDSDALGPISGLLSSLLLPKTPDE